jgi:hypothetical protein
VQIVNVDLLYQTIDEMEAQVGADEPKRAAH